jgi:hypothetical protein
MNKLALLGGIKAVHTDPVDIFDWPLVTPEVEAAVLEVLRAGKMSGTDVTRDAVRPGTQLGHGFTAGRHVWPGHWPRR